MLKDNVTLEDKLHHIRTEMARLLNKEGLIGKNDALKVKIVSTYLEQFNDNNRFDLRGLNTLHKRTDALNKVEEALKVKFPKIFKHIENLRVWDENKFLKDKGFDKFQDGQIGLNISFKIGNKESDWIRVYFKNIEKSDDDLFNEVKKYLEQFNMENPFALQGVESTSKWTDVLKRLKNNLTEKFGVDAKRIELTIDKLYDVVSNGLKDGKNNNNVSFKIGSKGLQNIRIYFKDIKKTNMDLINEVKEFLKKFNEKNRFDLKGIKSTDSWSKVLVKVKETLDNEFGNEIRGINFTIDDSSAEIDDGSLEDGESAAWIRFNIGIEKGTVEVYFKNIE
ncbi:hypothetical protein [Spiroplasma endosymbiont of Dilophus febrilis]|uniref:hypothetical protein n=1 Tax=Spiroplasma endosymbiont of Dilophus febrilis TaxID=3066292 RepID=UPI00313CDDDD